VVGYILWHFTSRETAPRSYWAGGWVGLKSWSGCNGEEKKILSMPLLGIEP